MTNIVEIKNVKNVVTEEIGTLYLIGSKDAQAVLLDNVHHQGLSIFFRPEGKDIKYIKSYVFTDEEARMFKRGRMHTMRDIGYFLDVKNTTLDIICLETAMESRIDDSQFGTQRINRVVFSLEFNDKGREKIIAEADYNLRYMCGFTQAVSRAFGEMVNITDDTIVPSIFPTETKMETYNYVL